MKAHDISKMETLGYLDDLLEAINSDSMRRLSPAEVDLVKGEWGEFGSIPAIRWEMSVKDAEQSDDVVEAAVTIVSSLGFCKIFGITVPSEVGTKLPSPLPIEMLAPAISGMLKLLKATTECAQNLPVQFDNSEPLEDQTHCTNILHSLMKLWAMFIVIDDEYQQNLCKRNDQNFHFWMDKLLNAFSELDNVVQREEQVYLLSIATELPLLNNWRSMLVEPYREVLPWWLDGTLEEAANQVRHRILTEELLGDNYPTATSKRILSM